MGKRTFPILVDKDAGTVLVHDRKKKTIRGRKGVPGVGDKTYILRSVETGKLVGRAPPTAFNKSRAEVMIKGRKRKVDVVQITKGYKKRIKVKRFKTKRGWTRGTIRRR